MTTTVARPPPSFAYPPASAPDIIRSNQKDAYFQSLLSTHLASTFRSLYGARATHAYTAELTTLADFLYLALTTLVGNRTLGEEYCDIVQVEDGIGGLGLSGPGLPGRLPALARRAGYVVSVVGAPYLLSRLLPPLRRRLRAKLEAVVARARRSGAPTSRTLRVQEYALANLDTLTSTAPVFAVSLATFYFTGAYYHLSKRLWGLRYVFSRELGASEARAGYEVLGVLLVAQLAVQAWFHARDTWVHGPTGKAAEGRAATAGGVLGDGVAGDASIDPLAYTANNAVLMTSSAAGTQAERVAGLTGTPALGEDEARVDLGAREAMRWLAGRQARKCTLCLEAMKDPSATVCGHLFCWGCIRDWCREKPECPLCRSHCAAQHILPLR